jgi:hypothetical protein
MLETLAEGICLSPVATSSISPKIKKNLVALSSPTGKVLLNSDVSGERRQNTEGPPEGIDRQPG